jgi:hypothetical protein
MPSSRTRLSIALLAGGFLVAGMMVWRQRGVDPPPIGERESLEHSRTLPPLPDPPPLESPYLNTASGVRYVGNEACIDCHTDQHDSYYLTGHSRALERTDPHREPPDAEYFHEPSGRWYQVYRDGNELRHREFVRNEQGEELVLGDKVVSWAIGSGHFSRSYLAEEDGFLLESPITWYAARDGWAMSPGFDVGHHPGFGRLAPHGCLACHAGKVEMREGNEFQADIRRQSIGCESCHGPGSLHVERYREPGAAPRDEPDFTIVNPARLDRELAESICANCHLRGEATVYRRGRKFNDFRPGFRLTDLRIDFGVKSSLGEMTVVGHVEQMRASRCYQQSDSLTCISCHDPHTIPAADQRIAYFRNTCLECHSEQHCGLELTLRLEQNAADNCITCHMPTTDTDIPHFAFTHHRIGIHREADPSVATANLDRPATLVPLLEPSSITTAERERALGLAYFEFAPKQRRNLSAYFEAARDHLLAGELDPLAAAALAGVGLEMGLPDALAWATLVLNEQDLPTHARLNALVVRGVTNLNSRRPERAVDDFRELVRMRRNADYWLLLSQALMQSYRLAEALEALENAVEIAPHRAELRLQLAELYRRSERSEAGTEQLLIHDLLINTQPAE